MIGMSTGYFQVSRGRDVDDLFGALERYIEQAEQRMTLHGLSGRPNGDEALEALVQLRSFLKTAPTL